MGLGLVDAPIVAIAEWLAITTIATLNAAPAGDHTVEVDVRGLEPDRWVLL